MASERHLLFASLYNDIENYPTVKDICREMGIGETTYRRLRNQIKAAGELELIDREACKRLRVGRGSSDRRDLKIAELQTRITRLKQELSDARMGVLSAQKVRQLIGKIESDDLISGEYPNWLDKGQASGSSDNIPVLFLSDIHFDETVYAEQIGGVNRYNREIAVKRIQTVFNKTETLLKEYLQTLDYKGIVVALGGDLLSGNIHEELSESNEYPILDSVVTLTNLLIDGIGKLADAFGKVYVPCVVGNHSRLHQKKRFKNKAIDNYEFIIYHYIQRHFADDDRVTVHVTENSDITFQIYGTRFLMTHGDQFRGGNGISGIFSPLMLGLHRKNARESAVNKPFDVMMVGHFHQLTITEKLIINGSIKGYDEYAAQNNLQFEPPQQALFVVNGSYGITFRVPIRCEKRLTYADAKPLVIFD